MEDQTFKHKQELILLQDENEKLRQKIVGLDYKIQAVVYHLCEFYPLIDTILWELGELD